MILKNVSKYVLFVVIFLCIPDTHL